MLHVDNENPNLFERIRRWGDTLPFANARVPSWAIFPLLSICLLFKRDGRWVPGFIALGRARGGSLFYNGALYVRLIFCPLWAIPALLLWHWLALSAWWLPLCIGFIGIGIRWAGSDPDAREFLQTYIGIKLNGEIAIAPRFRIQSDNSAAGGTTGPNTGQAVGWNEGNK